MLYIYIVWITKSLVRTFEVTILLAVLVSVSPIWTIRDCISESAPHILSVVTRQLQCQQAIGHNF